MINADAAAQVAIHSAVARLARALGMLSAHAGRPLGLDDAVFESERATGHRNRATGRRLRNDGIVRGAPEPALEPYFKQCSVRADCRDLAFVAATLASGGPRPPHGGVRASGRPALLPQCGRRRLSTGSPGRSFGEPALISGGPRMAGVRADSASNAPCSAPRPSPACRPSGRR